MYSTSRNFILSDHESKTYMALHHILSIICAKVNLITVWKFWSQLHCGCNPLFCTGRITDFLLVFLFNISNLILFNFIDSLITKSLAFCQDKTWSNMKNMTTLKIPTTSPYFSSRCLLSISSLFFSRLFLFKFAL